MENDLDIEELKELVKRQAVLNADTNKVVHSMRRAQRLKSLWGVVWWLIVVVVSTYTFYTYVWPTYNQIIGAYNTSQGWQHQVQDVVGQLFGTSTKTH